MPSDSIEIVADSDGVDRLGRGFVAAGIRGATPAWVAPASDFLGGLEEDARSERLVRLGFPFSQDGKSVGAWQASLFFRPFGDIREGEPGRGLRCRRGLFGVVKAVYAPFP